MLNHPLSRPASRRAYRALALGGTAMLILAQTVPAAALQTSGSVLGSTPAPSSGQVQGPPDGMIAPARPITPIPLPSPRPTPAPAPAPAPRPTPVTPAPRPTATPTPRATPAPTPAPVRERPAPQAATRAANTPTPAPAAATPVEATPVEATPPASTVPPAAPPPIVDTPVTPAEGTPLPAATPSDDWPAWVPPAVIALVALLGGALYFMRRRRKAADMDDVAYEDAPSAPVGRAAPTEPAAPAPNSDNTIISPTPAASAAPAIAVPLPVTPVTTAEPARAIPRGGRRADLSVAIAPISASTTLINLRLRYALTLRNDGLIDAANITLRVGLFAGQQASEQGVGQWLAMDGQPIDQTIPLLAVGEELRLEQELAVPMSALSTMEVEGRHLAILLMAVDARYAHPDGETLLMGQTGRAFVIGRESGGEGAPGKLLPFRMDQGPTNFAPLGARDTGISRSA